FMGECATNGNGQGSPTPNLRSALGDAAFLGGLERNSDVVIMECYAPLLVNVSSAQARQWPTNLIGYDALNCFGSPSYYIQKMYRENGGDRVLPVEVKAAAREEQPSGPPGPLVRGRAGVGTWLTRAEYKDMKITSSDGVLYSVTPENTKDWTLVSGDWAWDGDVLRQTSDDERCRATIGERGWTDYTYSLKARKISGAEGFL